MNSNSYRLPEEEMKLDEAQLLEVYEKSKNDETFSHEEVWKMLGV